MPRRPDSGRLQSQAHPQPPSLGSGFKHLRPIWALKSGFFECPRQRKDCIVCDSRES